MTWEELSHSLEQRTLGWRKEAMKRIGYWIFVVFITLGIPLGSSWSLRGQEISSPDEKTPYDQWLEKLEIPLVQGAGVEDLREVEVKPWPKTGGLAGYFRLVDSQFMDARVHEIPAGKSLKAEKHLFEENLYILDGSGYTLLQQEGKRPQQIDWKRDTAFSIPLNTHHQHFNGDDSRPARFLAITNFPFTLNTYANVDFIEAVNYAFRDRYDAEEDYVKLNQHLGGRRQLMNVIPDVNALKMYWDGTRGAGFTTNNVSHRGESVIGGTGVSELAVGTYKKAHAHLNEAMIYIAKGEGYSVVWKNKNDFQSRKVVPWREGSLVGVPKFWYHHHFNTGNKPARFVKYTTNRYLAKLGTLVADQIEYEDEDPEIEELFRKSSPVIDPMMEEIWAKRKKKQSTGY